MKAISPRERLEKWNEAICAQKASGLTIKDWCAENGINPNTYDYYLRRIRDVMLESSGPRLMRCNETSFVVVQNGKSSGTKDYMWLYHTGPEHGRPPVYLYQYSPTRKTEKPRNFLKGCQGILVTDGYQVHHTLEKESGEEPGTDRTVYPTTGAADPVWPDLYFHFHQQVLEVL